MLLNALPLIMGVVFQRNVGIVIIMNSNMSRINFDNKALRDIPTMHRFIILFSYFQVLVFLDSHIEATEGWLEALLYRIHLNKLVVPAPAIDNINYETYV